MKYRYLYQDGENRNCEGEIKARSRDEAYAMLRKSGIRPYRLIGNDPWNWRPWAIGAAFVLLAAAYALTVAFLLGRAERSSREKANRMALAGADAAEFRARAAEAVANAPEAYRYNVWKGVNARLEERGLDPLPKPPDLADDMMTEKEP